MSYGGIRRRGDRKFDSEAILRRLRGEPLESSSTCGARSTRQTRGTLRHLGSSPLESASLRRLSPGTSSYSSCP
jgi:hypothetical protein